MPTIQASRQRDRRRKRARVRRVQKVIRDPRIILRRLRRPFYHICDVVYYSVAYALACIRHGGARTVIVLPDSFDNIGYGYRYSLWRALREAGVRYHHRLVPHADLAIAWQDETEIAIAPELLARMQAASGGRPVINALCTDIRKSTVGRVHQEVFGYSLDVDPETCTSPMVRKSERNFQKDGVVLRGPVPREEGYVYQRLVDNEVDDRKTVEYRVPVIGSSIPWVLQYNRPLSSRFGDVGVMTIFGLRLHTKSERIFSPAETASILAFTKRMGCDYTELDVLRSTSDGRIYIVDCNHTPGLNENFIERYRAVHLTSKAFYRAYLRREAAAPQPEALIQPYATQTAEE